MHEFLAKALEKKLSQPVNLPKSTQQISEELLLAEKLNPLVAASSAISSIANPKLDGLVGGLQYAEQIEEIRARVASGDFGYIEEILISQILVLQNSFTHYTRLAAVNQHLPETCVTYSNIAVKAADECRKIAQTLHEMKHPKRSATFIKKAIAQNIETQNNLLAASEQQLLEPSKNAEMDTRSQGATTANHPKLEALGIEHRPVNSRRKSKIKAK